MGGAGEVVVTQTERWVNEVCDRIMSSGYVRLYKDLYKDLRERLPCGVACRLIREGLAQAQVFYLPLGGMPIWRRLDARARALDALRRLERWADVREWGECCGLYDGEGAPW
jgi:hypothetical protein